MKSTNFQKVPMGTDSDFLQIFTTHRFHRERPIMKISVQLLKPFKSYGQTNFGRNQRNSGVASR